MALEVKSVEPHGRFMRRALELAERGLPTVSPNPAVGAVIVRGGEILSEGYHRKAGLPHAEINAITKAGEKDLSKSTLYVTLEPCCHWGRTPPCTDAILKAGIRRVVIGSPDPNPRVSGRGARILKDAGIDVIEGVLEDECRALNEPYNKYITTGLPFLTLKLAGSLDGRIATLSGDSRWITGEKAREHVHRLRALADAVMVGANTVIKDDPELTVRLVRGVNPVRVIVDSSFRVPLDAKVFAGPRPAKGSPQAIVITTRKAPAKKIEEAISKGITVIKVRETIEGAGLRDALKELGRREITRVLVEGGGALAASLLKAGLVDRVAWFAAPVIIGSDGVPSVGVLGVRRLKGAVRLKDVKIRNVGGDVLVEGRPQ